MTYVSAMAGASLYSRSERSRQGRSPIIDTNHAIRSAHSALRAHAKARRQITLSKSIHSHASRGSVRSRIDLT
jgi:hypothetical protein